MRQYRYATACAALCCGLALLLSACDTAQDDSIDGTTAAPNGVSNFAYTYDSGEAVRVVADPTYTPARRSFESLDAYHAYLDELDAAGSITVNASLWERLHHANDPAEVSVLDAAGTVVVGKYIYEVGPEAVYRTPLDKPDAEPELEFYYGLSGDEDLKEFDHAALAYGGMMVDEADLKNPFAKEMVQEATALVEAGGAEELTSSGGGDQSRLLCTDWYASDSRHFGQCDVNDTYIPVNMSGFLPSGYQTASGYYDTRVWMLNQSYRKVFKKKAYAATQIQVRRAGSGNAFFGLGEVCPIYNDYVDEPPYTINNRNMFEVQVRVEGRTSSRRGCYVSYRADRSGGSESYHWAWSYLVAPPGGTYPAPGNGFFVNQLSAHYLD
jgi:hypothetical protein